jgi:hypothetical protein
MPIIKSEHYFPNIDDPEIILRALNEERQEWDDSVDKYDPLEEYFNDNTRVYRLLNKSVINT